MYRSSSLCNIVDVISIVVVEVNCEISNLDLKSIFNLFAYKRLDPLGDLLDTCEIQSAINHSLF